ncbi:hypothetical protein Dimus_025727 [Dionaea muscipula]
MPPSLVTTRYCSHVESAGRARTSTARLLPTRRGGGHTFTARWSAARGRGGLRWPRLLLPVRAPLTAPPSFANNSSSWPQGPVLACSSSWPRAAACPCRCSPFVHDA